MERIGQEIEELARQLASFGILPTENDIRRIQVFCEAVIVSNQRAGLISPFDLDNLVGKHVAASVAPMLFPGSGNAGSRWVDVGSGGGFPGLVLGIMMPESRFTLIDGSQRKCLFLEEIVRRLQLPHVEVLCLRVESLIARQERLESFDLLTCRAVADLDETLSRFSRLVRPGGEILTYKGPSWQGEVARCQQAGLFDPAGFTLEQVLEVPFTRGRILQIRKGPATSGERPVDVVGAPQA